MTKTLVRATDPITSVTAAESTQRFVNGQYRVIRRALKLLKEATPKEIAANTHLDSVQVTRRLSDFGKAGIAEVVLKDGDPVIRQKCRVWRLK